MKKTLLSLLVGLGMTASAAADDLFEVYKLALDNDPVVNRAKADRDAAYEGISISRANLLPQISGSIGYTDSTREQFNTVAPNPDGPGFIFDPDGGITLDNQDKTTTADLRLSLSIYDHANWVGLDRAEKVAQQSDSSYAVSKQELIVRVTRAYLAVLRAKDGVEFVQAEKRAIERQLEQTKQRFEVGLTAITDVHEAQANFDNTVANEIRALNDVELRLEELREITGKYHGEIAALNTDSFSPSRPSPSTVEEWLAIAEDSNLDLLVQKFARDIAKEDIDAAFAGHFPTLSLTASKGWNDNENTSFQFVEGAIATVDNPRLDNDSIGIELNVPIYLGGRVSAQTKQARYRYVSASEQLEQTHRSTVRSVRSSYNDVTAAVSTIKALQQAVVSAESALKATEAGFEVGTRTIVDVLESTSNLFNARNNLAGARYDFIEAVVNLKRAAGNLSENDLVDINRGLTSAG